MTSPTVGDLAADAEAHSGIPTFTEALAVWLRVAVLSFGGPTAQVAVMHRILVEEKKWISESRFLHALNYCMLLPGPEAQQLATYLGWMLHGVRGGVTAGALFVVPGFLAILALSWLYVAGREWTLLLGVFFGIKPAIVAVVLAAVQRLGKRVLRHGILLSIAAAAFMALHFAHMPFPFVIFMAGSIGAAACRWLPSSVGRHSPGKSTAENSTDEKGLAIERMIERRQVTPGQSLRLATICLALWWLPVFGMWATLGPRHTLVQQALFFSRVSVVTFGGAYSVLSYVQQRAVGDYGWVTDAEMIDGLGMAESTPGPLIQVVQFVGFLGAFRAATEGGTSMDPWFAGLAASVVTTWVTYVPCFLWIFLGAPYIERLRGNARLNAALTAVTAAVVGVVFHLAVTFATHVLFRSVEVRSWEFLKWEQPVWQSWNGTAILLFLVAAGLLLVAKRGMLLTLAVCAALGVWLA